MNLVPDQIDFDLRPKEYWQSLRQRRTELLIKPRKKAESGFDAKVTAEKTVVKKSKKIKIKIPPPNLIHLILSMEETKGREFCLGAGFEYPEG